MEVISAGIVLVGLAAAYAWWDVAKAKAQVETANEKNDERFKMAFSCINGVQASLDAQVHRVDALEEKLLDTRNSVTGLKTLAPRRGKYG